MADGGLGRPAADEYDPWYASYVARIRGDDVLSALEEQLEELLGFIESLDPSLATFRYAPDKWSIKEVLGHVVDSERIFATRALCIARGEAQPLPGFDQDAYVTEGRFDARTLADLASEMALVRRSSLALFRSLDGEAWNRAGIANDARVSVRAIPFILAGHAEHHLQVMRERYLQPT